MLTVCGLVKKKLKDDQGDNLINLRAADGTIALHHALAHKHIDCIEFLIKVPGVNLNASDHSGYTPLHLAVMLPTSHIALALIEAGSKCDMRTDYERATPLHLAAFNGSGELVEAIVTLGRANVALKDKFKQTVRIIFGQKFFYLLAEITKSDNQRNTRLV